MKDEALKLALEALEKAARNWPSDSVIEAITAIKQALEAPVQEPYGYFRYDIRLDAWVMSRDSNKGVPFYTTPPAQRQSARSAWVGLTEEEHTQIVVEASGWNNPTSGFFSVARAIEAKLKEKNT